MYKKISYMIFATLILMTSAFANATDNIQVKRNNVITKYVSLLGKGDYKTIPTLFTNDAIAVSSSGKADHVVHFYKTLFTKTISNPKSSMIDTFKGNPDKNMMVGYFDFHWKNKSGHRVSAKFLDLFVFENGSAKIKQIYIFSNTFTDDIMKQLRNK